MKCSPDAVTNKQQVVRPKSIVAAAAVFASGNIVVMILRFANTLLTARMVAPEMLGSFNAVLLAVPYISILQFGVVNGLGRELPFEIGRGNKERAERHVAAASAWMLLLAATSFVCLCAVASWFWIGGERRRSGALVAAAFQAAYYLYAQQFLQVTYRTRGDFQKLAVVLMVEALLTLGGVALVWISPFAGLCIRTILVACIMGPIMWTWRPMKTIPCWDRTSMVHLVKIGLPIYIVGQMFALWPTLNSTWVAAALGSKAFGFYALSLMVTTAVNLAITSLQQVVYPRMAEEYGRTQDVGAALRPALRATVWLAVAFTVLCGVGWFCLPTVVRAVLPKYQAGVQAARWALLAGSVSVLGLPFSIFPVIRRLRIYGVAMGLGIVLNVGFLVICRPLTLDSFPRAQAIGYIMFAIVSHVVIYSIRKKDQQGR